MMANVMAGNRKSTCLYLDNEIVETVRQIGLNISRVSENDRALEWTETRNGPR
jgi:post-segregation antitoxin (ccd killing protein)